MRLPVQHKRAPKKRNSCPQDKQQYSAESKQVYPFSLKKKEMQPLQRRVCVRPVAAGSFMERKKEGFLLLSSEK